jgi:hypothetical protein
VCRHPKEGVADDPDRHLVAEGDLVDLLLHRTGVGVDQDHGEGRVTFPHGLAL